MINMDQVRTLELKVKQAVQLIVHLRKENDHLRNRLADTEVRIQELENLLNSLKASQSEIEQGIRSALEELDHLETEEEPGATSSAPPVASTVESHTAPAVEEMEDDVGESELIAKDSEFDEVQSSDVTVEALESEESLEVEEASLSEEVPQSLEAEDRDQPGLGIF